jgi:orotate phosphoribosyltransferase
MAIFSYEFEKAYKNFSEAGIKWETISNFPSLLDLAIEENYLSNEEAEIASKWNAKPEQWGRE